MNDALPPGLPTPPAHERKWSDIREAEVNQLRRDVGRLYTVCDRTEDRVAVLVARVSKVEELIVGQSKLLVAIAEKLGVGL